MGGGAELADHQTGLLEIQDPLPDTRHSQDAACEALREGWQAVIVCEIGEPKYKVALEKSIGIDVGLTSLATLSDGSEIANPRWVKQFEKRLARMNRELSRKQRRSKNRARARQRLRRLHQRIAGRRQSYLHPITRALVERYDLLAFEKLNIRTMARSRLASPFLMPPGENSSGS